MSKKKKKKPKIKFTRNLRTMYSRRSFTIKQSLCIYIFICIHVFIYELGVFVCVYAGENSEIERDREREIQRESGILVVRERGQTTAGGRPGGQDDEGVGNRCQPKSATAAALLVSFVPEEINRTGNLSNANNALFLRFHRLPSPPFSSPVHVFIYIHIYTRTRQPPRARSTFPQYIVFFSSGHCRRRVFCFGLFRFSRSTTRHNGGERLPGLTGWAISGFFRAAGTSHPETNGRPTSATITSTEE